MLSCVCWLLSSIWNLFFLMLKWLLVSPPLSSFLSLPYSNGMSDRWGRGMKQWGKPQLRGQSLVQPLHMTCCTAASPIKPIHKLYAKPHTPFLKPYTKTNTTGTMPLAAPLLYRMQSILPQGNKKIVFTTEERQTHRHKEWRLLQLVLKC